MCWLLYCMVFSMSCLVSTMLSFDRSVCHAFQVGIYVTSVRETLSLCATHALTPYAKVVLSRQIFCASEGIKDFVEHA